MEINEIINQLNNGELIIVTDNEEYKVIQLRFNYEDYLCKSFIEAQDEITKQVEWFELDAIFKPNSNIEFKYKGEE